jgi:ABC-type siderophore export system fused ATPase/permease subunit
MTKTTKFSIAKDGLVNQTELFNDDGSTQQHVRVALHTVLQELGVNVVEEWEMDDDSIEITVTT